MPVIGPISAAVTYLAAIVILGCGAAWLGSFGATRFDVWRRRRLIQRANRIVDEMHIAPECEADKRAGLAKR